ncbi:MAG: HEAT repeat domain-containing protein [Myxococcales bacterium]|jgi:HEAT repeat protein
MKNTTACALVLAAALASPAFAQPVDRKALLSHLKDTGEPVNVPLLQERVPKLDAVLCDLARDSREHWYARKRAAAALTEVGGDLAFSCLVSLATDAKHEATLRRFAMYALGRRFASERPAEVLPVLKAALASANEDDRDRAIRALAYAPAAQAEPILRTHAAVERNANLAGLAQRKADQLAKRQ